MFLTNLFNLKKECQHNHVAPNLESAYCPDCGKLIKNEWYITRCSCCGVKLKSVKQNNNIVPQFNYCCNCGSKEYVIEKLDKIDFININFAVLIKRVIEQDSISNFTQCWQEKTSEPLKLSVKYL